MLARQRQIEKEEQIPNSPSGNKGKRRGSTMSENSILKADQKASIPSRNNSVDSRCMQNLSANDLSVKSPETQQSPKKITDSEVFR
jgi:hypothetical protein